MADTRRLFGKPQIFAHALNEDEIDPEYLPYAQRLVQGVADNLRAVDTAIASRLTDYDFFRIAVVDRQILRIAAYEILFEPGLAPAISVSEAVVIAKKYSTAESGKFVNGVLGRLVRESDKADWDPGAAPPEAFEQAEPEPEESESEETVEADDEAAKDVLAHGWKLRANS